MRLLIPTKRMTRRALSLSSPSCYFYNHNYHYDYHPFQLRFRCYSNSNSNSKPSHVQDLHVAIVGSGPSGFYTAKYLHSSLSSQSDINLNVNIDILDALPTPFGLVRSGVAPDHPEVKNVQHDFTALFHQHHVFYKSKSNLSRNNNANDNDHENENEYNSKSGTTDLEFFGHVQVGPSHNDDSNSNNNNNNNNNNNKNNHHNGGVVSLTQLTQWYDIVVLAYGCQSDKSLPALPGQHLKGIVSARPFVNWYNGTSYAYFNLFLF